MAYAIVRHQLMDIAVIIKKTLVFAGLLASVFAILIMPTIFIQEYIFRSASFGERTLGLTLSGIIIIFTMRRIESFLMNITDKYLFQKKYDYKELLKAFTQDVLTVMRIDDLIEVTKTKLKDIMKLDSCDVLLDEVIPQEAIREKPGQRLNIPIVLHDRTIGVLSLGKKKSDEDYTQDDLDILLPLARTLAVAISNAKLLDELSTAQAEAAEREKMATIGTLAAGMAHEIRNPITTIRTFVDYLPERYRDDDFVQKFNKLIPKEIDKIDNIAYSLLEFSASEDTAKKESVDLADVIKVIVSLLEPQYRFSEINIDINAGKRRALYLNKRQIQDIFFNIIKYVISETPRNSVISISIKETVDDADGAGGPEQKTEVIIKDRDLRIPDYIVKNILEPISGLYKERRGLGFGLFIARELVERNGGKISIFSDDEMGSEFVIRFKNTSRNISGQPL